MDDAPNRAEPEGALPLGELEAAVAGEAEAEARARLEPSAESREKAAALAKEVAPGADPLFDDPSAASGALPAAKPGSAPESERAEHVRDIVPVRAHQKTIEIRRVKVQGDESRRAPTQKLIRNVAADGAAAALAISPEEAALLQADDGEAVAPHGDGPEAGGQPRPADATGSRLRLAVWVALFASVAAVVLFVLWSGPPPSGRGAGAPSAPAAGAGTERSGQGGAAAPAPSPTASSDSSPGASAAGASSSANSSATSSSGSPGTTGASSGPASSTAPKHGLTAATGTSGLPAGPSSAPTAKATTSSTGLFFEKGSSDLNKP